MRQVRRNDDELSTDLIVEDYNLRQEAFKRPNRHARNEKPHPRQEVTDALIKDIIAGKWGFGYQRKIRLKRAGYNYETVKWKLSQLEAEQSHRQ